MPWGQERTAVIHAPRRLVSVRNGLLAVAMLVVLVAPRGVPTAAETSRLQADPPADVAVQALAAGGDHTCALLSGGVKCWGSNFGGKLGDGTTTNRTTPVNVSGLSSGVQAITTGLYHSCALAGGGVMCWGNNQQSQLGDGTSTNRSTPVNVSGLSSGVQAIIAGAYHTCALLLSGGVQCWGHNYYGQLGDSTITNRRTPVNVFGLTSGVQAVAAGEAHTCALLSSGGVQCWGENSLGQLGNGTTTTPLTTPANVSGLSSGVQAITTDAYHTCALLSGGVMCWGYNNSSQLGDGTVTQRTTPVNVARLSSGVQAITAGGYHTCALMGGGVQCWGSNTSGQLGDGTVAQRTTPASVVGMSGPVQVLAAGSAHTCALPGVGMKCWGHNLYGQLGDGSTTNRDTPVNVSGLDGPVQAITAGQYHTCALLSGGVKCWGYNNSGQLSATAQ